MNSKGNRRPDSWLGVETLSGPRSRPSGAWCGYPGSGAGVGHAVLSHRFSHRPISGGRWQPRVAGGGPIPFSPQRSPPLSPLALESSCPQVLENTFRSQVSAIRSLVRVSRFGCRSGYSALCHRFSHRPISGGGWQPRVAGGGPIPFSHQRSPPFSPPTCLPLSIPNRQPLTAITPASFPPVLFSSGPLSSANVLSLHSSPSRRLDAA
jgi:hypothetical protein